MLSLVVTLFLILLILTCVAKFFCYVVENQTALYSCEHSLIKQPPPCLIPESCNRYLEIVSVYM